MDTIVDGQKFGLPKFFLESHPVKEKDWVLQKVDYPGNRREMFSSTFYIFFHFPGLMVTGTTRRYYRGFI